MPQRRDGLFYRRFNWEEDRDAGIPISAERMDLEMGEMINALNGLVQGKFAFQGPVKVTEGSAAEPALSFGRDGKTGFFRRSDGALSLVIRGEEVGVLSARFFTMAQRADLVCEQRQIATGAGLKGGGDLSQDLCLSLDYASEQDAVDGTNDRIVMTPLRTKQMLQAHQTNPILSEEQLSKKQENHFDAFVTERGSLILTRNEDWVWGENDKQSTCFGFVPGFLVWCIDARGHLILKTLGEEK